MGEDGTGARTFPIWPHPRYAEICATGPWAGCTPTCIALDTFMEKWLPGMTRDQIKVVVFPAYGRGDIVAPVRLENDLVFALEEGADKVPGKIGSGFIRKLQQDWEGHS